MKVTEYIKNNIVYLDGGLGTLLQSKGLTPGEHPELWNISHKNDVIEIHKSYYDAGSNIVCSNTFGANSLKFSEYSIISNSSEEYFSINRSLLATKIMK